MKIFEISAPGVFRDYMKVLSVLKNEVNLKFSPDGLSVLEMDDSHVAMVDFHLPMEVFDRWDVEKGLTICLNLEEVNKALGKINKRDSYLRLERDNDEQVIFTLISDLRRKKTIKCLEPLDEEVPTPKIFFKSGTRVLLSALKRILDDFKGSSQFLGVKSDSEKIVFFVEGNAMNEETAIGRDNDNVLEHRVEEDSKATFNHEELHKFVRAISKISEVVTFWFSEDLPLKLDVELPQGYLYYYQAPCIDC